MLIRTFNCPPQPWKNGGGTTRELLAWPSKEAWKLRISVADITKDGAFSRFEGVQRSFAVMEGAGVKLMLSGDWKCVTMGSEPIQFDGSEAPDCKLIDGATRDLNVMYRLGCTASLARAYAGQSRHCKGLFSIQDQSLMWLDAAAHIQAPTSSIANQHIGWWIDFDDTKESTR